MRQSTAIRLGKAAVFAILTACCATGSAHAADFSECLASLKPAALAKGVTPETFEGATNGLQPNDVLPFQTNQPEFSTPPWDYMAGLVDDQRIADGKQAYADQAAALQRIGARYGVDPAILVAVWGVESDFGRTFGARPVVQSLATLACYGRKPEFYRGEFVSALLILQRGDVAPERFNGSWAGAFGHTQFMPSTFLRHGVDFEGTGHANIVDSVPDALATTAAYLRASGWQAGAPWGYEVKLPAGYNGPSGRKNRHPAGFWAAKGVTRADSAPLTGPETGLLLLGGPTGPAFLVTRNFDALYTYNAAEVYALAIGVLADRIAGGGPLVGQWPTDDPGLSRIERREVQEKLIAAGFAIGNADGVMGTKTREAIADYQARVGLPRDGRASVKLLQALRAGR
ncbi:lytic murein transglycosylase [Lichenifustis flavocetrariae]|uniref:Lytic murein transglycosylase n=1 Tax=Lichenifustis flavocetrariae TaxID=2949735 RepID=A0AA41Z3W5_9HYPH|nr:lytic murein transglycosylase [Lichenifustis flavocetrariae]MCW6512463.1 lytic murein transglycosylase [Lichenifustis flavocetrariae]